MVVRLSEFDFELPPDRIAQTPIRPRDAARLLCVRGSLSGQFDAGSGQTTVATLDDRAVRELPDLLRPGDILVANDTRVILARLTAHRGDARVGITLDQPQPDGTWHALARNARRLREGDLLRFDDDLRATVTARDPDGGVTLRFNQRDDAFAAALRRAGALALPPYIHRPNGPETADAADYQTIFASTDGAVAAPTAGLHFTPALLAALESRGIRRATVTLHVGAGTFLPVRSDDVEQHHMHAERGEISVAAARAINEARSAGGRVIAVGTTSLRLLESAVAENGTIEPFAGQTSLFILPEYQFRAVDLLMTNFHLPRSTLFMLVCAFAGTGTMREAYAHAVAGGYRFYSYGDSSLLYRHDQ
jgi:S-adenosylmethionine:tRNA ribosyltransferase-isomerase